MHLRGFDDYEVTLGDQIRGERASMGKSIADVERELRIRADMIVGIEECDLATFPNRSVVAGYVRSYARYLRLDPDEVYARFCAESGFEAPNAGLTEAGTRSVAAVAARRLGAAPSALDESRFAVPPARSRFAARISLGSLASAFALVGLICGLGYGGLTILKSVQQVGFAPLPDAPDVVVEAPLFASSAQASETFDRPTASDYDGSGALAAVFAPDDEPPIRRRESPISAIDPVVAGVYRGDPSPGAPLIELAEAEAELRRAEVHTVGPVPGYAVVETAVAPGVGIAQEATEAPEARRFVAVHAAEEAWIRVRAGDRSVIFEGLLAPGENFELPERVARGTLRAGNAGAVYVLVDGVPHGPVGRPGGVAKGVSLAREDIAAAHEPAPAVMIADAPADAEIDIPTAALGE